ncbi:MAG: chemotaxis protein CheD [archaeon]|nr:chemotaxis protein CheD [archaeon]
MAVAQRTVKSVGTSKKYIVGIAEMAVSRSGDYLMVIGLGSCIGTVIWDKRKKIGGLCHTLLPSVGDSVSRQKQDPQKFAESAIPIMIKKLLKMGANKSNLVAKISGGSQMFAISSMAIGEKNAKAAKKALMKEKIPIIAEDLFGTQGRTIVFDINSGQLVIKRGKKELRKI